MCMYICSNNLSIWWQLSALRLMGKYIQDAMQLLCFTGDKDKDDKDNMTKTKITKMKKAKIAKMKCQRQRRQS